jgi:hypothetical protein
MLEKEGNFPAKFEVLYIVMQSHQMSAKDEEEIFMVNISITRAASEMMIFSSSQWPS